MNRQEYYLAARDGPKLFIRHFQPEKNAKAIVVLVHGFSEHSGRYVHWAERFVRQEIEVYAMDYRGHGNTEGIRGHTPAYSYLLDDIESCIEEINNPDGKPVVIYGQSLGGNMVLNYALWRKHSLAGVISTSPWLKLVTKPKTITVLFARILRLIAPRFINDSKLDINMLSHDPQVVIDYEKDPLTHSFITPQLFFGSEKAARRAIKNAGKITIPILLMHGTGDLVTSWRTSEKFAKKAKNTGADITFVKWTDYYHELHNEINNDAVFDKIMEWMNIKIINK
ncbi:MAG: alpha/beta hydrolase [Bacteroidales bacterium]